MDGWGHPSGWERAALEEAVGEPITVHVLTAHPLYRQPRGRRQGPLPALSARRGRAMMNGPLAPGGSAVVRVPRAEGDTAWPLSELRATQRWVGGRASHRIQDTDT